MTSADVSQWPGQIRRQSGHVPALAELELRRLEEDLSALCARLDAVAGDPTLGGGLAAMRLDRASQAIHLALLDVRDCLRAPSSRGPSSRGTVPARS